MPQTISVYGTCLSREPFNGTAFQVLKYETRTCLRSIFSPPPELPGIVFKDGQVFKKRKVLQDLEKGFFSSIREDPSDFFLMDFRNEMWQTAKFQGRLFTFSDYFKEAVWNVSDFIERPLEEDSPASYLEEVLALIPEFIRQLTTLYPAERIILHEAYLADTYRSQENQILPFHKEFQKQIHTANAFMAACHQAFRNYDSSLKVLRVEDCYRISDENHRWTISPAHFIPEYNQRFLEILKSITLPASPLGRIDI